MAKYSAVKATVNAYIKQNGRKEITGRILNAVLNATIDSLGKYFQFAGGALPTDDPGTPDQNVCYLAGEPGVYTNFGGITIENEEVALLFWDGEWTKQRILIGIREVNASVDSQVGTPSVDVSYSGGELVLTFHNLKGEQGETGDPAGFGTIGADINGGVGTPGVSVETSGDNTAKDLMFHFTNLKGETGVTSVVATIDDTSGTPSCQVSLEGQQLTLAFSGLKGLKGDTGVSADYPITIYNGLDSDATDQALAAAQGKVLDGKVNQLEQKADDLEGAFDIIHSINLFDKSQPLEDGYINSSGGIGGGSNYKLSYAIPIVAGHYYLLAGRNLPTAKGVRCLDSQGNPLKVLVASTGTQYVDWSLPNENGTGAVTNGQFLAPDGAVSFQFNAVWNNSGDVNSVMLIDLGTTYSANPPTPEYVDFGTSVTLKETALPSSISEELNDMQESVSEALEKAEEVDGKIDKTIEQEVQEEIQNDEILENSYIKGYGDGDIATLNHLKVFRFPIVGGQRYLLTGLKATSDSIGFAIFHTSGGDDNANKIAGSYYSSYGDENPAVDREVTAPENAAYLYVQRGNTVDSVVPKCVHVYSETINVEENVLAIGDTAQLGGTTIVEKITEQGQGVQGASDILMLNALSGGMKLRSYSQKHPFSWSFPKPIVSIKIDDLHPSVDLAVKIAEEIGINVVLGAPASQLGVAVTGITDPSEKIGDTALEVCQYLYAQGGEIAEHSTGTFTDESQIKAFFIDQKSTFLKNGIILRGAAVANSFPSDELKDKLEPYLRFYYDYSNGYGKEIPYNTSGNLVRSHTYGTNGFTTPAEVLAVVDTWKNFTEKGWHTITFHAVGGTSSGGYNITEADYRTILTGIKDRADNGDFNLMIWGEVYDTYGMYN